MERGKVLEDRGCQVVVVGFGEVSNGTEWKAANKLTFQLLMDQEQKLYKALGVRRSVSKVWNVPNIILFAEWQVAGTLHMEHFEGDDLQRLKGDFISDSSGKLVWCHFGEHSADRPSLEDIQAALDAAEA